jgi:hypothetical protein
LVVVDPLPPARRPLLLQALPRKQLLLVVPGCAASGRGLRVDRVFGVVVGAVR